MTERQAQPREEQQFEERNSQQSSESTFRQPGRQNEPTANTGRTCPKCLKWAKVGTALLAGDTAVMDTQVSRPMGLKLEETMRIRTHTRLK